MSYVDVLLSLGAAALIFSFIKLYTHRRKFKDLVSTRIVFLPGSAQAFAKYSQTKREE